MSQFDRYAGPEPLAGAPYTGAPATFVDAQDAGLPLVAPRWGLPDLVAALVIAIIVPTIIVTAAFVSGAPSNGAVILLLSLTTPWLGFGLYPILATRLRGNGPVIDLGWILRPIDLAWGLGGGIACLVLGDLAARATEHFVGPFDSAAGDAITHADVATWVRWAFVLCAVIGAPAFEELCFRGLAFASVAKWFSRQGQPAIPWATAVSALLFSLIHFEPVRIPVLLTIGLVLSLLRARTGRVGASMVAHALNNGLAVIGILGIVVLPGLPPM